ncbi:MAG: LuxR C-terminal-related transcriptional regulator, partial [Planctomycetota bacterium]
SERLDLVRLAIEHAKPIKVEGLIGGLHCLATVRPIDDRCVLMTLRQCAPSVEGAETTGDGGAHLLRARHDDAGPLSQLTAREIDVLRHIGMGMSTAAIAQALHRSVKTIEWHRVSLGNKLGITNRVELARIAIASGLSPVRPLTAGKSDRAEPAPAGETG